MLKPSEQKSLGNITCSGLGDRITNSGVLCHIIRKAKGKTGHDEFIHFQVRNQVCKVSLVFVDGKLQ